MHMVGRNVLCVARRPRLIHACRVVSGVRQSVRSRNFHRSAVAYRIPKDPTATATNDIVELDASSNGHSNETSQVPEDGKISGIPTENESLEGARREKARGNYGSATRRTNRNKHSKELPPLLIPDWFWKKNVKCIEQLNQSTGSSSFWGAWDPARAQPPMPDGGCSDPIDFDELLRSWGPRKNEKIEENPQDAEVKRETSIENFLGSMYPHMLQANLSTGTKLDDEDLFPKAQLKLTGSSQRILDEEPGMLSNYVVSLDVFSEVFASVQAGLSLPPPRNVEVKSIPRPDLLLQCPREDSSEYLNMIVACTARLVGADLIVLNPEDLAQILGDYMGENIAWSWCSTALLGYETGKSEIFDEDPDPHDAEDVDEDAMLQKMKASLKAISSSFLPSHLHNRHPKGIVVIGQPKTASGDRRSISLEELLNPSSGGSSHTSPKSDASTERWANFKLTSAVEKLIDTPEIKRSGKFNEATGSPEYSVPTVEKSPEGNEPPLVIQINGYKELLRTEMGNKILKTLRVLVKERWNDGRSIIIVGTSAAQDLVPALSRGDINRLQSDVVYGDHRTIFVPPGRSHAQELLFRQDEKRRIQDLNIRHVEDMLKKLTASRDSSLKIDLKKNFPTRTSSSRQTRAGWEIDEHVWDYARVHRVAVMMLGFRSSSVILEGPAFAYALDMIFASDSIKFQWAKSELEKQHILETDTTPSVAADEVKTPRDKLKDLRKHLTPHEQSLIGGVVNPESIHTTFADVRAPSETVEALRTLTTLSLIRPEAFSYGVLATDKIPGLLLYGPPGTGKTLLAKAVAKESGATVLEVSGSDLNEMYVGEGEKKVKALFTLAKKLTPCVVFIDEADALFGSRNSDSRRTSHRELINQFLREWDGMNDLSAFIMVATNRPFDIDEAILRRLPRRLLVDLPLEADRLAILKIHLKDEILDEDVDLLALAKNTPFYSGSDLKNISVAAALACVREENEVAAAHPADSEMTFVYPEKRVLKKRHFDKAMEEISASINEDMSTLAAIRKFDERYGDRKGRRKKSPKIGFGGPMEAESDAEAGRIRRKVVDL